MHASGIKPFVLWPLAPQEAYLCAARALAEWMDVSDIKQGYIFRKLDSGNRVKASKNEPIVRDTFSRMPYNLI